MKIAKEVKKSDGLWHLAFDDVCHFKPILPMCAIWMTVSECMECTEWPPRQNHSQADKCGKLSFRYCFLWKYLEYLIYSSSRSHWDDLHDGGWLIRLFLAKCGNIITHSWSSIKWSEKARGGKIENTFKIHWEKGALCVWENGQLNKIKKSLAFGFTVLHFYTEYYLQWADDLVKL